VAKTSKLVNNLGRCALVSLVVALVAPFLNVALGIGEPGASPFISLPEPGGGQITLKFQDTGPWWERLFEQLRRPELWEAWSKAALAFFVAAFVASIVSVQWGRRRR